MWWVHCVKATVVLARLVPVALNGSAKRSLALYQMDKQSSCHRQSAERGHEHRSCRAILGNANLLVMFGVQVVGQRLERGVEKLSGYDCGTRERHERPPQRLRPRCNQETDHHCQRRCLKFQTVFHPQACN